MTQHKRIALGVTGSIAAYKACEIISRLRDKQIDVSVIMTKEAQEFITPLTLQILSGNKVICGLFALPDNMSPAHISLARQIDLLLIAPATANVIAKLAAGIADDALTCLALSVTVPVVICPAMNERMFQHKLTQRNVTCLKEAGCRFVGPERGRLVCGGEGLGHLAKVETIVQEVVTIVTAQNNVS